jgi:predicted dehydrogenase
VWTAGATEAIDMSTRLRVGVLGLGQRWQRCLALLPGLRGVLEVSAVCDPRPGRAEPAARALHCAVAAGPNDLLERDDVRALLLFDAPWYGLWPLEVAARLGKPVFCAATLAHEKHADTLNDILTVADLPVLMALPALAAPSLARLTILLNSHLGPARLVRADRVLRPPEGRNVRAADLLSGGRSLGLLHAMTVLLGGPPLSVQASAVDGGPLVTLLLEGAGRAAQVSIWTDGVRRPCRIEVVAPHGSAVVEGARRLHWRGGDGEQLLRLPARPLLRTLLDHFARSVRARQQLRPNFSDAYQALRTLRAARLSLSEGRPVEIASLSRAGAAVVAAGAPAPAPGG